MRKLGGKGEKVLRHIADWHVTLRAVLAAVLGCDPNETIRFLSAYRYIRSWPDTLGDLSAYTLARQGAAYLQLPRSRCFLPGPQALTQRITANVFTHLVCTNFSLASPDSLLEDFGSASGLWLFEHGRSSMLWRVYCPCDDTRMGHLLRHLTHLHAELRDNDKIAAFLDKRWAGILVLTNQHKKTAIEEALAAKPYSELFERTTISVRVTPSLLTIPKVVRKEVPHEVKEGS